MGGMVGGCGVRKRDSLANTTDKARASVEQRVDARASVEQREGRAEETIRSSFDWQSNELRLEHEEHFS